MINRLLVCSFLLLPFFSFSQSLPGVETNPVWSVQYNSLNSSLSDDDGTFWTEGSVEYESLPYFYYGTTRMLNGVEYQEVLAKNIPQLTKAALIRQEGSKVFQAYAQGEVLLYDFELNVGDPFTSYLFDSDFETIIDSVQLEVVQKELVKGKTEILLEGNLHWFGKNLVKWIEGIGSANGPLYHLSPEAITDLQCFQLDKNIAYQNNMEDSCGFQKNTTLPFSESNVRLQMYPNLIQQGQPIYLHSWYMSSIPKGFEGSFCTSIYSLSGQLVAEIDMGLNDIQGLETAQLQPGMYVVRTNFQSIPVGRFVIH